MLLFVPGSTVFAMRLAFPLPHLSRSDPVISIPAKKRVGLQHVVTLRHFVSLSDGSCSLSSYLSPFWVQSVVRCAPMIWLSNVICMVKHVTSGLPSTPHLNRLAQLINLQVFEHSDHRGNILEQSVGSMTLKQMNSKKIPLDFPSKPPLLVTPFCSTNERLHP